MKLVLFLLAHKSNSKAALDKLFNFLLFTSDDKDACEDIKMKCVTWCLETTDHSRSMAICLSDV
jgi:hypothetical protein